MPNDMITLKAHAKELSEALAGGKINKISAAGGDIFYIFLRAKGKNRILYASVRSEVAGIFLTERTAGEFGAPNNFCMCLRKHLVGATVEGFDIINEDRIVAMRLISKNELNDAARYSLITEIMGGASNIVLTDGDDTVIDAAKRILNENSRPVYPHFKYEPPKRGKILLSSLEAPDVLKNAGSPEEAFAALNGLSKESAAELYRLVSEIGAEKALSRMDDLYAYEGYSPAVSEGSKRAFYAYPYSGVTRYTAVPSLSAAMDLTYSLTVRERETSRRSAAVRKRLSALEKKLKKHIEQSRNVLSDPGKKERYLELGEILKCNFSRIQRGMSIIECYDFYNTRNVKIELNPTFSAKKNVEHYFKQYAKAKGAESFAREDLKRSEELSERVKELKTYIRNCSSEAEFKEIDEELSSLSGKPTLPVRGKAKNTPKTPPYREEIEGFTVFVGKNSKQNERVTFELAGASDVWLHAKNFHGAHGLIVSGGKEVPDSVIERAAAIVAGFSECADAPKAEVDYTLRKFVKRLKGSRVTYTEYKTVVVKPLSVNKF